MLCDLSTMNIRWEPHRPPNSKSGLLFKWIYQSPTNIIRVNSHRFRILPWRHYQSWIEWITTRKRKSEFIGFIHSYNKEPRPISQKTISVKSEKEIWINSFWMESEGRGKKSLLTHAYMGRITRGCQVPRSPVAAPWTRATLFWTLCELFVNVCHSSNLLCPVGISRLDSAFFFFFFFLFFFFFFGCSCLPRPTCTSPMIDYAVSPTLT